MSSKKQENPLLNLVFSVIIPSLILTKASSPERLGPVFSVILALSFPLAYSIYDFAKRRDFSFITGLGFVSTLLTGIFVIYQLPTKWIAVKEASIPFLIGSAILFSMRSSSPLVKKVLYNDSIINVDLVEARLESHHQKSGFEKLLEQSSYLLAGSFLLSAILNFTLARYLLVGSPGTPEFNEQLGKMHAMSWPVIALPSTAILMFALWRLMKGIESLTGLTMEEVLKNHEKSKSEPPTSQV